MLIAIDAMGGDRAPEEVVAGAYQGAHDLGVEVLLVGRQEAVRPLLRDGSDVRFQSASEVIAMDEHPAAAVRAKRDSSMSVCARLCRDGAADAWVSAGNSGAVMAAALLIQGRLPDIDRPALGTILPTAESPAFFLDVGANVDSRPEFLFQFAQMGAVYAEAVLKRPRPRIGLLSNGEEAGKGDERVRAAHDLLRASGLNFVGNVEPKEVLAGAADVVVGDGFVGNVAIKMAEATAEFLFRMLREEIPKSPAGMVGGLLIKGRVGALRARLDWREFGGAPLLGIDGVAVVAHGRSDARAITSAIRVAAESVGSGLVQQLRTLSPAKVPA